MVPSFVDDLKDRINRYSPVDVDRDIADDIRNNPKYVRVIDKIRELNFKRDELLRMLYKVEVDIDACLVLIGMDKEKEDIDRRRGGF